ncbi:MAG: histidinol-phosphate transaminase [Phycisphaerales bacterium]
MLAFESQPAALPLPTTCEHGGRAFEAIGEGLTELGRRHSVIAADVLDAWFPPAPEVLSALREHLDWALSASPPAGCAGLIRAIASARGLPEECLAVGAGSSALIYQALTHWLARPSRALVLEPSYGEYAHVLERLIGCRAHRLPLREVEGFAIPVVELRRCLASGQYDLAVIVNPNNPTGTFLRRAELEPILAGAHPSTTVWVDEAYVEYAEAMGAEGERGTGRSAAVSVEGLAAASRNVVVCKSLSKAYALSGARAAYLCGPAGLMAGLRERTPPWAVSLPAQVAAVRAMGAGGYYRERYRETHALRGALAAQLRQAAPWRVVEGCLNSVLCLATLEMPRAAEIAEACRKRGLYIRDCSGLGQELAGRAVRIAVRRPDENARMVHIIADTLSTRGL